MKFKTAQIHFLNDVSTAVASWWWLGLFLHVRREGKVLLTAASSQGWPGAVHVLQGFHW